MRAVIQCAEEKEIFDSFDCPKSVCALVQCVAQAAKLMFVRKTGTEERISTIVERSGASNFDALGKAQMCRKLFRCHSHNNIVFRTALEDVQKVSKRRPNDDLRPGVCSK